MADRLAVHAWRVSEHEGDESTTHEPLRRHMLVADKDAWATVRDKQGRSSRVLLEQELPKYTAQEPTTMATHEAEILDSEILASSHGFDVVEIKYKFLDIRNLQNRVFSHEHVVRNDSAASASSSRNSVLAKPGRKVSAITKVYTPSSVYMLLVAPFKPAVGTFCLELPTGPMLQNQTAQQAAITVVKELTGCQATAPIGGKISPWTPIYADLCSDCVTMVELSASFKDAKVPPVVATTTQGGEPIHIVHVPVHHFLESVSQIAMNHGFEMSSHVYAIGLQLSSEAARANVYQLPPASAPPAPGDARSGAGAGALQAGVPPIDGTEASTETFTAVARRIRRVSIGIVVVAAGLIWGSRWNHAEERKAAEAKKR